MSKGKDNTEDGRMARARRINVLCSELAAESKLKSASAKSGDVKSVKIHSDNMDKIFAEIIELTNANGGAE